MELMTMHNTFTPRRCGYLGLLAGTLLALGACGGALDVQSPTTISADDINSAHGADLLYQDAQLRLGFASGSVVLYAGLFADEFLSDPSLYDRLIGNVSTEELHDRRETAPLLQRVTTESGNSLYAQLVKARLAATVAMMKLRAYESNPAHLGETFAMRAFATLMMAENLCPGFPLNTFDASYVPVYGPPMTTDQALEHALAEFDSAIVYGRDSARILNFARLGRGRALLGLGRFTEAAAAVDSVPTDYVYTSGIAEPLSRYDNPTRSVSNLEGSHGLDFVQANDPRVPVTALGPSADSSFTRYDFTPYMTGENGYGETPIPVASGVEGRLIQAEAALHDNQSWLPILDSLRATIGLDPLSDPGTADGRVDLVFRERAFWLFATGHRLGDLRRLISRYGRTADSVFPIGQYPAGGAYGTATSVPFPASLETPYNPAITGCTDQRGYRCERRWLVRSSCLV